MFVKIKYVKSSKMKLPSMIGRANVITAEENNINPCVKLTQVCIEW